MNSLHKKFKELVINNFKRVSVIIDEEYTIQAVKKLHKTFKLD